MRIANEAQDAPGYNEFNEAIRCAVAAVLCVFMSSGLWFMGEDFSRGLDPLMSSFNYFRVVLAVGCLGWLLAAFHHVIWARMAWREGERLSGVRS